MFPKRQVLDVICQACAWQEPRAQNQVNLTKRLGKETADGRTAEIQTVNSGCLKPLELEDTKYLP